MTGILDQKITFQSYAEVPDGAGGITKDWQDLDYLPTVWADVSEAGGSESVETGRLEAAAITQFTVHNRSDIDERFRIVWSDRYYNIRQVIRQGRRHKYLIIVGERGVAT
ncbi:MAG: phage head closure protein [Paracoccaceae bacterium]